MMRADVIELITETEKAHGVHKSVTETARKVYCTVQSVSRSEFYNALNAGIQPEIVFKLALDADYQGEHFLRYGGKKYRIVRTYLTNDGGIEIMAERSDENGTDTVADNSDDNNG